jgi:TPR repeat protein
MSQAAMAQDLMLFPPSSFGQVVAPQTESLLGDIQLEAQVGDYNNEFVANYGENSVFARTGRSVGILQVLTNIGHAPCTAFLVDDNKLITNHHCVPGVLDHPKMKAQGATSIVAVQFHAGFLRDGINEGVKSFMVDPTPLETNAELDYSVLQVIGDANAEFGALELASVAMDDRAPLWVIGHPMGEAQRISREKCQAGSPAIASGKLRHTCDTLPGNSGSPVIDPDSKQVIALHHAGSRAGNVNYAIPMADILRQSKVLRAAAAPAPVAPAPQADPCDGQLLLARRIDQCVGWQSFLASCPAHAGTAEAQTQSEKACKINSCDAAFAQARAENSCATWQDFDRTCADHEGAFTAKMAIQIACAAPAAPVAAAAAAAPAAPVAPAAAASAVTPPPAAAPTREQTWFALGGQAYRAKAFPEAAMWYRKAADAGDGRAQGALAAMYENGLGVEQSIAEALGWYKRAALQGNAYAIDKVEELGRLGQQDARTSEIDAWYRLGSEAFSRRAHLEAALWYRKAAEAGDVRAQGALAALYENGMGVPKDLGQATDWYERAAVQGNRYAGDKLRELASLLGADPQPSSESWFEKGRAAAQAKDYEAAAGWYRKAAAEGHERSQEFLGNLYSQGLLEKDLPEAIKWYRLSAAQGNDYSRNRLSEIYADARDKKTTESAVASDVSSSTIWNWRLEGETALLQKDYARAAEFFAKAAEHGETYSQCQLSNLYATGRGVARNARAAANWFMGSVASSKNFPTVFDKTSGREAACDDVLENREVVREIQKELKRRGLYAGTLDGITGPQTRAAMRRLLPN